MNSSLELWQNYHQAVQRGEMENAKKILQKIMSYKGNPPPPRGGCAKCRKRLY
jgi:hypothetical protein